MKVERFRLAVSRSQSRWSGGKQSNNSQNIDLRKHRPRDAKNKIKNQHGRSNSSVFVAHITGNAQAAIGGALHVFHS